MSQVSLTRQAELDYLELTCRFLAHGETVYNRFEEAWAGTMDTLARFPEIAAYMETDVPSQRHIRVWNIRGFDDYLVFYRVRDGNVLIMRVAHGAQSYDNLFPGPAPQ